MKKYLLLLVMFIATIGYIAGLYGFFHNLNFIFHEITITPWLILRGMFPLAWGIMALLTFVMAEYVYRQRFHNAPHFRLKRIIWSKIYALSVLLLY